ncbi:MAG: PQQ-binding-like beta-propeller repeat protein [Proteobacteria bacterium]|nr:PQQ-binding-like beta-propeller repeat protein [Pseudomonadota bacterium]
MKIFRWNNSRAMLIAGVLMMLNTLSFSANAGDADWAEYGRDATGWRYSPLDQINKGNVQNLKVAWIHQPGDMQSGLQAHPIAIGGILYYVGSNNNVFAIDGATGKAIWHYKPELHEKAAESFWASQSRGVTVGLGHVYLGSLDGRYIALDQKTGEVKWETQLTDFENCQGCNFSFPPQLAGNILYSGHTGGDQPQQGKIYGVNALTGEKVWEFNTIKDDPKSWPGDSGKIGGGGAWMTGMYDAAIDTIYLGTSNAAPDFNNTARLGDNLYTATIIALQGKTGKLLRYHQEVPNDSWDYDSAYEIMFIERGGKNHLVHLNKGGFVSVLDPATLKPINVWKFAQNVNWVETVNPATGALVGRVDPTLDSEFTFCPSLLGARSWQHAAYNPNSDLWYSNAWEMCNTVMAGPQDPETIAFAALLLGVAKFEIVPPPSGTGTSRLSAHDPITGKLAWSIDYGDDPGMASVLTTAGGLVFNGNSTGDYMAYDADNGNELWRFNVGSGMRSGPISYSAGGKQYILVPTGWGGLAAAFAGGVFPKFVGNPGGAALIAFSLD